MKNKRDVLIIAHFCEDLDNNGNGRFNYLSNLLTANQYNVELVTSDFSHNRKCKKTDTNQLNLDFNVSYIKEPSYKKNVSIKRLYSHYIMSRNLKKYLRGRQIPDIVYCAVPSLNVAKVAAQYAKRNNIKFIIDIQDIWPEAFKLVLNIPVISDIIFYPMKKNAEFVYRVADEIIAVSKTYGDLALKYNKNGKKAHDIFLGTELDTFDKYKKANNNIDKSIDEIWLAYAGTLGHSYNITAVIDALDILKKMGINNIKFIIMGDGPLKKQFEEYANEKEVRAMFTGRLNYDDMVKLLTSCDIAVNPIGEGSAASIINKHGDYAAAGLPVVNTQESLEYRSLIKGYNAGFNSVNNNAKDLADCIYKLYQSKTTRVEMGKNHRRLAEEKFDRSSTYYEILKIIQDNLSIEGSKHNAKHY